MGWKEQMPNERIIKDDGAIVLFGTEPFSSYLRLSNIKLYKYDWKWIKDKPTNFIFPAQKSPPPSNHINFFPLRSRRMTRIRFQNQNKYKHT